MKKNLILTSVLCALLIGGYAVFWFVMADRINENIDDFYTSSAVKNMTILGGKPRATGFPGPPEVSFIGQISAYGFQIIIPELTAKGFPLPGQMLSLTLPQGFQVQPLQQTDTIPNLISPDYVHIAGPVPETLPADLTVEDLRAWRDRGGTIQADRFTVSLDPLQLNGQATLTLDDSLQPAGVIPARISGHMAFIGALQKEKMIDARSVMTAGIVLTGLTQEDRETGERFIKADISIEDRTVFIGPLGTFTLPKIIWPYKHGDLKN